MRRLNARLLIIIGFILVVLGFVLPVLMVMQIIESTFFLNFFSYGASVVGLALGIMAAAYTAVQRRHKK